MVEDDDGAGSGYYDDDEDDNRCPVYEALVGYLDGP